VQLLPRTTARMVVGAVLLVSTLGAVAGCSRGGAGPNAADRTYAEQVVEHHAQTLQILDLALGRPGVTSHMGAVADGTRRDMFAEASKATRRLRSWHLAVPVTALEHHEVDTRPHYDQSVPGMLSADDLAALQHTRDGDFVAAWLGRLVSHEAGAVRLAGAEVAHGADPGTVAVARADLAQHRHRLTALRALLERLTS